MLKFAQLLSTYNVSKMQNLTLLIYKLYYNYGSVK